MIKRWISFVDIWNMAIICMSNIAIISKEEKEKKKRECEREKNLPKSQRRKVPIRLQHSFQFV